MGRKRTTGLIKRNGVWHIDKELERYGRLCQSCGTGELEEAEKFLARRLEEVRQATVYGVRPPRKFRLAATKYLEENGHKRAIGRDAQDLQLIDPFVGDILMQQVHMGSIQPFIEARRAEGTAVGTINRTLAVVRRVLNLAARLWRDEFGLSWLETAPMIQLLPDRKKRKPYPLSWDEQHLLFPMLPEHLHSMALYKVNTGCREQEVVQLRWDWEVPIPELETSVFVIPAELAKNGTERVIVLNRVARSVVNKQRGVHPDYVFAFKGGPVTRMYNSAWKRSRRDAAASYRERLGADCPDGFRKLRVHDLKHTFGRRLRAADVSFENRQDLLGYKSSRVTTDYSAAELGNLVVAADRACEPSSRKSPAVTFLRVADRREMQRNSLKTMEILVARGGIEPPTSAL